LEERERSSPCAAGDRKGRRERPFWTKLFCPPPPSRERADYKSPSFPLRGRKWKRRLGTRPEGEERRATCGEKWNMSSTTGPSHSLRGVRRHRVLSPFYCRKRRRVLWKGDSPGKKKMWKEGRREGTRTKEKRRACAYQKGFFLSYGDKERGSSLSLSTTRFRRPRPL